MSALARAAGARFEVYAAAPRWFFDESVRGSYRLHDVRIDVGFVQRDSLAFDLPATVSALRAMLPFREPLVEELAREVRAAGCRAVLCDIAPLGIAVAERAGLPSVLLENFTWPWLYEPLLAHAPELAPLSAELERWFARATIHVQTAPVCREDAGAALVVPPISRPPRGSREEVRRGLSLEPGVPVVVLTMGGVPQEMPFLDRLRAVRDVTFLVTGAARTRVEGNVRLFDNGTRIYMPDLVRAADAVVAKLGYSTLSEVWREGRPLARVTRPDFRESETLAAWSAGRVPGFEIEDVSFATGDWLERLPELLAAPTATPRAEGGAERVARFLTEAVIGG